ncbi:MIT domain-containing protein 1 [Orchesella cincta]|uniref:MIT domain-containing protein 1 n=1 Tax=Orchesella cincta TaxID=48709 RepID=A0A1D2NCA6_ORCCI|nr:MIT domain-containing protein 1 [Orchesella cincta]
MEGLGYAISVLKRAVELDTAHKYTESLVCYQEGIQILVTSIKGVEDESTRTKLKQKTEEYMGRAEKLKKHVEELKKKGSFREQMQIDEGATGYSYDKVFSRFLDHSVHRVDVEDPYIRSPHQCDNFLRFVEMCLRQCPNLKTIALTTKADDDNHVQQNTRLAAIRKSVFTFSKGTVQVTLEFSDALHDREIRLDNGWVIKIGRGLDYFKPVDRLSIGWSDYHFRPCKATTVDIFHNKDLHRCHY